MIGRRQRRIAFVVERLAGRSGGAERVLIGTANALAARGHQVEVITHDYTDGPCLYPIGRGVVLSNLRRTQSPGWGLLQHRMRNLLERAPDLPGLDRLLWLGRNGAFWRRLSAHLGVVRPDVAIAFMPPAITALGLAQVDHPLRRIASIHNAPEQDFDNPARWDPSRLDRRRRLQALGRMDAVTVLLPAYEAWFAPEVRDAVAVVPNAVTPVGPERLAQAHRGPVVMAVGRLTGVKRHDLLIEAWSRVAPAFPGWELHVFGEGPLHHRLEAMAKGQPSVRLMGHRPDIRDRYLSSAILAHPAAYEGFPLAVTEALAAGLPVVGFEDCSGLNALVEDGVNGVLVPAQGDRVERYARALASLMENARQRDSLGAAGPGSVAAYAPDIVTDLWEALIAGDDLPGRLGGIR